MTAEYAAQWEQIKRLEYAFERELITDRWTAAETAYALAVHYRTVDIERTREWLATLLQLLEEFPNDHLQDTVTRRMEVGGVLMPEFLHDGVVKARFEGLIRTI
jgi:hypothetical protein